MTLKENIRQSIKEFVLEEKEDFSLYSWLPYFIDHNKMAYFPEVGVWDDENNCESTTEFEPLDFENSEILSITENVLTFCAGGDWQEPMTVELIFNPLTKTFICNVASRDYHEGMSNEDFLRAVGVTYTQTGRAVFPINDENVDEQKQKLPKKEITTEDCKTYILNYYRKLRVPAATPLLNEKNWKRTSKRGTGIIYREFRNTVMGTRVQIESTNTEILSLTQL